MPISSELITLDIDSIAAFTETPGVHDRPTFSRSWRQARDYIARLYAGLSDTSLEEPARSFQELAAYHATRGGTNEQVLTQLTSHGTFEKFSECLDGVMRRVTAVSQ